MPGSSRSRGYFHCGNPGGRAADRPDHLGTSFSEHLAALSAAMEDYYATDTTELIPNWSALLAQFSADACIPGA